VVQVITDTSPPLVIVPLDISHTNLMSLTVTFDGLSSGSVICTIGGVATTVNTVSADYSILPTDNLILVTAACTVTLPDPTGLQGKTYSVKDMAINGLEVVLDTYLGIATIDTELSKTMIAMFTNIQVFTDGTNWFII
jgi:hypothetical protein